MEKVKYLFAALLLAFAFEGNAQEEVPVIRKGLLSVQVTLCPTYMFSDHTSYFFLHGALEGYVSPQISISGEGFYYLGSSSMVNLFDYNHSLFFGASRHFTKNNNDFYVGFQPGVSFTKLYGSNNNIAESHMGVNPLLSPLVGYNFYFGRIFHFFVQTRLVVGRHNYDISRSISEWRFSAGLGFNINSMR